MNWPGLANLNASQKPAWPAGYAHKLIDNNTAPASLIAFLSSTLGELLDSGGFTSPMPTP